MSVALGPNQTLNPPGKVGFALAETAAALVVIAGLVVAPRMRRLSAQ